MIRPYNNNKARKILHYKGIDCWAPNNGGLVSYCHERLYTLGTDVDKRIEMDKVGKRENEHRKRVSSIRDT